MLFFLINNTILTTWHVLVRTVNWHFTFREEEQRAPAGGVEHPSVQDFTTLFPSMHHDVMKAETQALLQEIFDRHGHRGGAAMQHCFLKVEKTRPVEDKKEGDTWVKDRGKDTSTLKFFSKKEVFDLIEYLIDNAYTTFGGQVYRQHAGVPIGFGASPALANFVLAGREIGGVRSIVLEAMAAQPGQQVLTPGGMVAFDDRV